MSATQGSMKWSHEQIQFVLDNQKQTASKISELFNSRYAGLATMSAEQVKYVRHRYREHPDFRHTASYSHVNNDGNQQATKPEVEAVIQPPFRPAFQPNAQPFSLTATATSGDSQNFGSRSDDHSDEQHVNNDLSERAHPSHPTPEVDVPVQSITFRAQPIVWLEGPHEGCPFQGTHHHEPDGGVTFPSVAALMDMVRRMKEPSFSLAGLADAMEHIEREEAEAKWQRPLPSKPVPRPDLVRCIGPYGTGCEMVRPDQGGGRLGA